MISRDYTKEVGIPSQKKTIPRSVAFVVLAIVAVGVSFGVAGVVTKAKEHNAAERAASQPGAAPAPGIAPVASPAPETVPAQ
jgi:anti-sigma factor RsiW